MWNDLSLPWQAAFEQAWEAYCNGSVPIGAALTDETGQVIATGRSMQFERSGGSGRIAWSKLSHAELNALLQASAHDHPKIKEFTLYTTVEPCPLCFGALVMSNVRNLCFAARDSWAGSVNLASASPYIKSKQIRVTGPVDPLEAVSIVLHSEHFLRYSGVHNRMVIDAWEKDCPTGVRLGRDWYNQDILGEYKRQARSMPYVFDRIRSALDPRY